MALLVFLSTNVTFIYAGDNVLGIESLLLRSVEFSPISRCPSYSGVTRIEPQISLHAWIQNWMSGRPAVVDKLKRS